MKKLSVIICLVCLVLIFERCENIFETIGIEDKPFLDSIRNTDLIYDLDRKEYPTFDTSYIDVGKNFKNEFIQTEGDDSYIFVGTDVDSNLLVLFIDTLGQEKPELRINNRGKGALHSIASTINPEVFAVTGEKENELYYSWVSVNGVVSNTNNYMTLFQSTVGAIDYVKGYDIIQTKDGGNAIVGVVKQIIGDDRLFILKLNNSGGAIWLKTFYEKAIGTSITEDNDGNFYVSGYKKDNGHSFLVKVQDLGNTAEARYLIPYTESNFSSFNSIHYKNGSLFMVDSKNRGGSTYMRLMNLDLDGNNLLFENNSNGILYGDQRNQNGYSLYPTVGFREEDKGIDNGFILFGLNTSQDKKKEFYLRHVNYNGNASETFQSFDSSTARISYAYEGSRYEIAGNIIQTNDYGFAAIGLSSDDGENYRLHLLKTDAVGAKRPWQ